jgi:aspartyl protease family protein
MHVMLSNLTPDWGQIALYAVVTALAIMLLQKIPYVGKAIRFVFSLGILAFCIFLLLQQAPFDPTLGRFAGKLGLDDQEVTGSEVRIKMARDGHFWAVVSINGVKRRMLIDSGATVTALSEQTAAAVSVDKGTDLAPVLLRTANGVIKAQTGRIKELRVGPVVARNLNVVISPGFGNMDVIGMNFLSRLAAWRVEENTLILVPHHPQALPAEGNSSG